MKQHLETPHQRPRGFTLIELLVVISIIGILASMLLPAISHVKVSARIQLAKTEMSNIASAITAYYNAYSRYPCSTFASDSVATPNNTCPDFTFGTVRSDGVAGFLTNKKGQAYPAIQNAGNGGGAKPGYQANNSEVVTILRDDTVRMINGVAINANHAKNPDKTVFLNVKDTTDPHGPGVGPDGVFRDPFGNPYIITLDLNYDDKCRDAFYKLENVSATPSSAQGVGVNGLIRSAPGALNTFEVRGPVMVWSFGPDANASTLLRADQGVNKDNILSWK